MARAGTILAVLALLIQGALAAGVCGTQDEPKRDCQKGASAQGCCCDAKPKANDCACTIGAPTQTDTTQAEPAISTSQHAVLENEAVIRQAHGTIEWQTAPRLTQRVPKEHRKPPDLGRAPPVA